MSALAFPFPPGVETGKDLSLLVGHIAISELERPQRAHLHSDDSVRALGQGKFCEYDPIIGEGRISAGKRFEPVDLRHRINLLLIDRHEAFGLPGRGMAITDFNNGQKALRQGRLAQAVAQAAEEKFIGPNPESDRRAAVVPTARAGAQVDAAAVGDETGFDLVVGSAQHDGIILEIGIHIAGRRQQFFKKLVAGPVRLAQRCFAPEVGSGRDCLFERGQLSTRGVRWSLCLQTAQHGSEAENEGNKCRSGTRGGQATEDSCRDNFGFWGTALSHRMGVSV